MQCGAWQKNIQATCIIHIFIYYSFTRVLFSSKQIELLHVIVVLRVQHYLL
uniref:Uncharacterized protein n=1 Tax=Amphimedon queenslandica TaxID=400682 RepID=A0A1X7T7Z0_AMPQE